MSNIYCCSKIFEFTQRRRQSWSSASPLPSKRGRALMLHQRQLQQRLFWWSNLNYAFCGPKCLVDSRTLTYLTLQREWEISGQCQRHRRTQSHPAFEPIILRRCWPPYQWQPSNHHGKGTPTSPEPPLSRGLRNNGSGTGIRYTVVLSEIAGFNIHIKKHCAWIENVGCRHIRRKCREHCSCLGLQFKDTFTSSPIVTPRTLQISTTSFSEQPLLELVKFDENK